MKRAMCSAGNHSSSEGGSNRSWPGSNARNVLSTAAFTTGGPTWARCCAVTSNRTPEFSSSGTTRFSPEPAQPPRNPTGVLLTRAPSLLGMNFTGIRTTAVLLTCSLALAACHSRGGPAPSASGPAQPQARPVSFDAPTTPQAAEKAAPPGDRTPQTLDALAVRGRRVLAAGYDNSFNVGRPMFLTSDDGGATWTRRGLDAASVARSGTDERPADVVSGPRGFVAAGESDSGPVLWSSTDGTSWSRPVVDRKVFRASDHVAALTTTPKGFLLVGTGDTSYGGNP